VADVHVKDRYGHGAWACVSIKQIDSSSWLQRFKNIRVDGLMTHSRLPTNRTCEPLTVNQERRSRRRLNIPRPRLRFPTHCISQTQPAYSITAAWGNMVRPGGVLYGYGATSCRRQAMPLQILPGKRLEMPRRIFNPLWPCACISCEVGAARRNHWLRLHL